MAHDTNFRPLRSDDPYSRDPAPSGRAHDPLAELARLIGQEDPLASARPQSRASAPPPASQPNHAEWGSRAGRYQEAAYRDPTVDPHDYQADPDAHYQHAARYEQQPHEPQYGQQAYDQQAYAADGYYDQQYAEEGYDEPPRQKRRGGLMTAAAVVGVAVIGIAGLFGYRAIGGHASTGGEPPVIKAEAAPIKTPAAPSNDGQAKQQYDRVGDNGGERMQSREEQPVDPRNVTRGLAPTRATPSDATGSVLPPLPAPTQSPVAAGSEPKRVKTVAIKPEVPPSPSQAVPPLRPAQPTATATQTATAPAPAPVRSAPASTSHYVQVSSQLSAADAQESFRQLQSKYPGQLGDQKPIIRRADLSAKGKGIVYRAMVGPFSSRDEATQLCQDLQKAGGQCLVQVE